jgi:hypothetical protein
VPRASTAAAAGSSGSARNIRYSVDTLRKPGRGLPTAPGFFRFPEACCDRISALFAAIHVKSEPIFTKVFCSPDNLMTLLQTRLVVVGN